MQALLQHELKNMLELLDQFENVVDPNACCSITEIQFLKEEVVKACQRARDSWALAAFNVESEYCLERYFSFQLQVLTDRLNTFSGYSLNNNIIKAPHGSHDETRQMVLLELHELLDHLHQYFGRYLDRSLISPLSYQQYKLAHYSCRGVTLISLLKNSRIDYKLKNCLLVYVSQFLKRAAQFSFSFGYIFYFELFLQQMLLVFQEPDTGNQNRQIMDKLMELDFNHLKFLIYRYESIKAELNLKPLVEQLGLLKYELLLLSTCQYESHLSYDSKSPSINHMLKGWLKEEIIAVETSILTAEENARGIQHKKIFLNLSVAHIACLIRFFHEVKLFSGISLTDLFKVVAANHTTKRQETISWSSLSKEYYSITQITAATVRDILQKMITQIDHDFFPK